MPRQTSPRYSGAAVTHCLPCQRPCSDSEVPDPRAENALHDLTEMLFIALLATLCGAKGCCDIALFARTKEDLLRTVLVLKHGVPSHDTFSRVFRLLDPEGFE